VGPVGAVELRQSRFDCNSVMGGLIVDGVEAANGLDGREDCRGDHRVGVD
jgi:hypothetical protein